MTRRALVAVALAAALALPLAAAAAEPARPPVPGGIGLATRLDPPSHLFGDRVTATVQLIVDPARVDPASIDLRTRFSPYRPTGPPARVERQRLGVRTIEVSWRLLCLREACRPPTGGVRVTRFPRAVATFRRRDGRRGRIAVRWYPATVASRLAPDVASVADWQAREFPPPPVSWRVAPARLGLALYALAALAALAGAALVAHGAVPALASGRVRRRLERSQPVDRALAVLREALARGEADARRKALDGLAVALAGGEPGAPELARRARRLAWSPREPDPARALALADDVEAGLRRRAG